MKIRYASLCSGISCESVAWMPLGWEPVFFAEIDPFACAVLKHHYPDVPNLGDIREIDGRAWRGKIDVLIAGTPCQSMSLAGKRRMLDDPRGMLSLEYGRIVNEAECSVACWENVSSAITGDGVAYGTILGRIVGTKKPLTPGNREGKWIGAGMAAGPRRFAAWRILGAEHFGVPQQRRRIFVVSVRAGERLSAPFVLFEQESMPGNSAPGKETGTTLARCITSSTGGASAKEQQLTFISGDGVPLNALEPVCMAQGQGGAEIGVNQCPTLTCNHEAPIAFSAKDYGRDAGNLAPTLRAMPHDQSHANGGGQIAVVYPEIAHTLYGEGHDASEDGTGRGTPLTVSLRGRDGGNTAELGGEIANALRTGGGGSDKPHVLTEMTIRRLTPRECELVMGLPADYTLISYGKGRRRQKDLAEMAVYWGVTPEVAATLAADSHRYRAVGNGMAVPVVRWLGERIELAMTLVGYVPVAERG